MFPVMFDPAFLNGETWGFKGAPVEHIETHAAHVFLVADRAFKIKKDVKLPYLDFSSVEKRRAVLADELTINRAYAPGIYRAVVEVRGEPALAMNRFDAHALLSWRMSHGGVDASLARQLARTVADAHGIAPRRNTPGAEIMLGLGAQLSKAFVDSTDIFKPAETLDFHALYEEALGRNKSLLNARGERGLVRRCHGDMHSGNIVIIDGRPLLFDAIEFSEKIATIDTLYDLAFLLMDLWRNGERPAANVVLNHYMHLRRPHEDLSGLALLPLFLSTRAGVRALVTADLAHELTFSGSLRQRGLALDNFRDSISFLKPAAPRLVCIGGLSGSGKSTLAARLAPDLGAPPGAIHVRSDVERKVLAGVAETEKLPAEAYSSMASLEVYDAILERAAMALRAGHSVVLDAVFARDVERNMAEDVANDTGASFLGLWLDAAPAVLKSRVAKRMDDASDATAAVIDKQLGYDLGNLRWTRIDASGDAAATEALVRRTPPFPHAGPA